MSNYGIRRGMNLGGKRKEERSEKRAAEEAMRRHHRRMAYIAENPESDFAKLWRGEYEPS